MNLKTQPHKTITVVLSPNARLQMEALQVFLRLSVPEVIEKGLETLLKSLPGRDQNLVSAFAARASETHKALVGAYTPSELKEAKTVTGKTFCYLGSLETGLEIHFEHSKPMKITKENIDLIKSEIADRRGPALMGAIFDPLMPGSIGEAIMTKHKLSPIHLSYVVPLLQSDGFCTTRKEGRNWYIEHAKRRR